MSADRIDPGNPLFRPVSIKQAMAISSRSRRTLERWVAEGLLTKYEQQHRRAVVVVFNEADVAAVEKQQNDAAIENRERIRRRGGRPGPRGKSADPTT